jgi:hypothetical protein
MASIALIKPDRQLHNTKISVPVLSFTLYYEILSHAKVSTSLARYTRHSHSLVMEGGI